MKKILLKLFYRKTNIRSVFISFFILHQSHAVIVMAFLAWDVVLTQQGVGTEDISHDNRSHPKQQCTYSNGSL